MDAFPGLLLNRAGGGRGGEGERLEAQAAVGAHGQGYLQWVQVVLGIPSRQAVPAERAAKGWTWETGRSHSRALRPGAAWGTGA